MLDIKAKIDEIVAKIKNDDKLGEQFKKEPVKAIEGLLGVDLPDEAVKQVVEGVKAKLAGSAVAEKVGGAVDKLKGLF
jgi:hypothetical protein